MELLIILGLIWLAVVSSSFRDSSGNHGIACAAFTMNSSRSPIAQAAAVMRALALLIALCLVSPAFGQEQYHGAVTERSMLLDCTPTLIANEPDPVKTITVGLRWEWHGKEARVAYFDAWHFTIKGNTYKRSEQYVERDAWIGVKADPHVPIWVGKLARDKNISMSGTIWTTDKANGVYMYKEMLCTDGLNKNACHQVTNSVCRELEMSAPPKEEKF